MKVSQLYDTVTASIIKELETGAAPWTKPWRTPRVSVGSIMPHNFSTGRSYSGINIPILWGAAAEHGYERHLWLTFRQALYLGGVVRKDEKSTHVVFTKKLVVKEACFVPSLDFVAMPFIGSFKQVSSYYATRLHELGHWSGAKHRLGRDLSGRFGTQAYAAKELIAELTAAFLCAHLGIIGELRHAGYIQNWIQLLKEDNRAIFTAASKASQAADYLRAFSEVVEDQHATA